MTKILLGGQQRFGNWRQDWWRVGNYVVIHWRQSGVAQSERFAAARGEFEQSDRTTWQENERKRMFRIYMGSSVAAEWSFSSV